MSGFQSLLLIVALSAFVATKAFHFFGGDRAEWPTEFGVDVTFPVHHQIDKSRYPHYAGAYQKFIDGCYSAYSRRECDETERGRLAMNLAQPASQHNYTQIGFKKLTVPKEVWDPLLDFYKTNVHREKEERWPPGNTYVNHWAKMTSMISFEDGSLRGGMAVKEQIWTGLKPIIEQWVGYPVEPTSLYGIRVYKNGNILSPHVDRLPLVSSAIIQVAQDVEEPWPLEVYDHAGRAHNVTMLPGDLVLYESHTVLHGRPFPMKGRFYANVFVHFQPVGHEERNVQVADEARAQLHEDLGIQKPPQKASLLSGLFSATARRTSQHGNGRHHGGHEQSNHDAFRRTFTDDYEAPDEGVPNVEPAVNQVAAEDDQHDPSGEERGTLDMDGIDSEPAVLYTRLLGTIEQRDPAALRELVDGHPDMLRFEDDNHWTVLHEAVRAGFTEAVRFLLARGADVFKRVRGGGDCLEVAQFSLPQGHEMFGVLEEHIQRMQ